MSARRSSSRRQSSPPQKQVRSRGLLVVTLLLVGTFAAGLAYIKQNAPVNTLNTSTPTAVQAPKTQPIAAKTEPAAEPVQSVLQIKPKYDFYNDLPKRQLVIGQDEIEPREKRELQPPPEPAKPKQDAEKKAASTTTAAAKPAAKPPPAELKIPKIELVSRQNRGTTTTAKPAEPAAQQQPSQQQATTRSNGNSWTIQAGAYSTFADAEKVRAKLALMGIQARIEGSTSNNKQIHRVRIGPLLSRDVAVGINQRLSDSNIPSLVIKSN